MVDNIGEVAGQIWGSLEGCDNKPTSLTTLAKNIGRKKEDVAFGVGWLAKEDKVHIEEKGATIKVCLKK